MTKKRLVREVKVDTKTNQAQEQFKRVKDPIEMTSADRIKGRFGRKSVVVQWIEEGNEPFNIEIYVLRSGELRLLGEKVYGAEAFDNLVSAPPEELAQMLESFGVETVGELVEKGRLHKIEVVLAAIADPELKDREWFMDEASDEFVSIQCSERNSHYTRWGGQYCKYVS